MSIFKEFWWVSAKSRLDTRDAQSNVWTRNVYGLSRGLPPEEVTTFNLICRLTRRRRVSGGLGIALHSRPLEGGSRRSGRLPSGADLEIAVEVAPDTWIDLVLQAKKFNPGTGRYDGWGRRQNTMMANWANANGRRSAGMLLYNSSDRPFVLPGRESYLFRLCCSKTVCHGGLWPSWEHPNGRSPLAISLILDVSNPLVVGLDKPTPCQIADLALPWECLFCRNAQTGDLGAIIGPRPDWVRLIEDIEDLADNQPGQVDLVPRATNYSVVIGMSDLERAQYGQ